MNRYATKPAPPPNVGKRRFSRHYQKLEGGLVSCVVVAAMATKPIHLSSGQLLSHILDSQVWIKSFARCRVMGNHVFFYSFGRSVLGEISHADAKNTVAKVLEIADRELDTCISAKLHDFQPVVDCGCL